LLTLPFVFEDLFAAAGQNLRDHLELVRLDPLARFIWPDGMQFDLRADPADLEQQIRQLWPEDIDGWRRLHAHGERVWDLGAELFLFQSPEQLFKGTGQTNLSPLDRLRQGMSAVWVPVRIGMLGNFARLVDRHIRSPRLRQVLYQYATYAGASPLRAPATLSVIPYSELHFGGWFIRGGMYRLAQALGKVAGELGVDVRCNTAAKHIEVAKSAATGRLAAVGVRLQDGIVLPADFVIANSDAIFTYRTLIAPEHRPHHPDKWLEGVDPGGSAMCLMLGVEGQYEQLAHHTKFMPADYRDEMRAVFDRRQLPADPCIYVCATTRTDPSVAPPGCENLFILVSAPSLGIGTDRNIDWPAAGPRYRDQIIQTLEGRCGLSNLSRRIVTERMILPPDFQSLYNANAGSIYGIGGNSRRSVYFRPPNRDRDIAGLFFVGGATHPGGGLPLVTLSGKIVADLIGG
jgi:phytoene desaturase